MFSFVLSLALGATLSPALRVASVTLDAAVATCFSPGEDCVVFTVHAIDAAERRILATSYALTTGSGIVEALVRANRRGVDVRLIVDKTTTASGEARSIP